MSVDIINNKPDQPAPEAPTALTREQVARMIHAIRRLPLLQDQTLATPQRDAEMRGILTFLNTELFTHADELLGCWLAVNQEYEPLIAAVGNIVARIQHANNARAAQVQATKKQMDENPLKAAVEEPAK